MLAEFVQRIEELAKAATRPELIGEGAREVLYLLPSGEPIRVDIPKRPWAEKVASLAGLAAAMEVCKPSEGAYLRVAEGAVSYFASSDKIDGARFGFSETEARESLGRLATGKSFGVKELRLFLRKLGATEHIPAFERIDWRAQSHGSAHAAHGADSLGTSVERAVQGADKIPEELAIEFRPYSDPDLSGLTAVARILVDIDMEGGKVVLHLDNDRFAVAMAVVRSAVVEIFKTAFPDLPLLEA